MKEEKRSSIDMLKCPVRFGLNNVGRFDKSLKCLQFNNRGGEKIG